MFLAEFCLLRNTRVIETSDPVNYRWEDGRLVRLGRAYKV